MRPNLAPLLNAEPTRRQSEPGHTSVQILGIPVGVFESVHRAAEIAVSLRVADAAAKTVLTCNVDHVMLMRNDTAFRTCYDEASLVTADGAPLVWLSRLIGRPVGLRVTGADLLPSLGKVCADRGLRLALVGGAPTVSDTAVTRLTQHNPGLDAISVPAPGPGFVIGGPEDEEFLARLKAVGADVVVVCFGAPKQELWMQHHRSALAGYVLIGAGAAVDFMAGSATRAPTWVQDLGVEWVYRLAGDFPRLWRRYLLRDTAFLAVAAGELWRVHRPGSLHRVKATDE